MAERSGRGLIAAAGVEDPKVWQARDFASLVAMERIGPALFRNRFSDTDFQGGHMFGGQLVAQALAAAAQTVGERQVHSLHAYFLRPGDVLRTVDYAVETVRDGRSFATRRVTALQDEKPLIEMICSASTDPAGVMDHQAELPEGVPAPEDLPSMEDLLANLAFSDCRAAIERLSPMQFVDARIVEAESVLRPGKAQNLRIWLRAPSLPREIDPVMQRCMLAYLQDYWIAYAPWTYQQGAFTWDAPSVASLDANVWFHRPVAGGEWLLYDLASPSGSGATGFTTSHLFDRSGALVASAAQEVLFR